MCYNYACIHKSHARDINDEECKRIENMNTVRLPINEGEHTRMENQNSIEYYDSDSDNDSEKQQETLLLSAIFYCHKC